MNHFQCSLTAAIFAGVAACAGVALAQTPASQPTATASPTSATTKAEAWTERQWTAMKNEWAKDRQKWTGCRTQAHDQKLVGRKSWSFLYQCMTHA